MIFLGLNGHMVHRHNTYTSQSSYVLFTLETKNNHFLNRTFVVFKKCVKCQYPSLNMTYPNSVNGSDTKYTDSLQKNVAAIQVPVLQTHFRILIVS